jgi:TetR/AcrR family transcriptional regulator
LEALKVDAPAKKRRTRIQTEKRELILEAALEVFSTHGFRGSTIDQIAEAAGMSKPNLLYYFRRKEDIHEALIQRLLKTWLQPLRELDDIGDPVTELRSYIRRKLEMARDYPRESRLFANEILQGAPRIMPLLAGELKALVDEKAEVIRGWMQAGKIARTDPRHLIFSIWATTQHYADFDVQVRAVLGPDRGGEGRFEDAARFLEQLYLQGLAPKS